MSYNKIIKRAEDVAKELAQVVESQEKGEIPSGGAFAEFVSDNVLSEELLARLRDERRVGVMQDAINSLDKETATREFALKLERRAKETKRKRNIMLVACSAVASAIIVVSFLVYNPKPTVKEEVLLSMDDITKPTLLIDNELKIEVGGNLSIDDYRSNSNLKANNGKKDVDNDTSEDAEIGVNRLIVPKGYTVSVELPDGSVAQVNSLSELTFSATFEQVREVRLKGEAFFEVKTDSTKQFRVHTAQGVSVNVYGTTFNVNTRRDSLVRALLVKGAIGVSLPSGEEVKVSESHMLSYDLNNESYQLDEVIVCNYLGYLSDAFKYERGSIYDLVSDLETWYDIKINNADILASVPISFDVSRKIELTELLDFLENMLEVKFIREGESEYSIEQMN